jgi:hypothetical protein
MEDFRSEKKARPPFRDAFGLVVMKHGISEQQGLAARWQMTLSAQEWAERYDANPEEEVLFMTISGHDSGRG